MGSKLKSYLRSHRRRWGLTQGELAYLLGLESSTMISRMERLVREPGPMAVIACRILFGVSPREIYPGLFSDMEDAVMQRAYSLYELLQGQQSPATNAKLDFLEEVLARAEGRNTQKKL